MKKIIKTILMCILLLIALFAVLFINKKDNTQSVEVIQVEQKDPRLETIKHMSLEEKVGSLMIFGFVPSQVNQHMIDMIQIHHVGGVNLLKSNIVNRDQTLELTTKLQKLYSKDHTLPFIIAVDQEGGTVVRINYLKEKTAEPDIKTEEKAKEIASIRAKELKDLGINMNFAPVVDFVTDTKSYLYNRTFATTSIGNSNLAKAMAEAYIENGIMPVYKHFPGYGNSSINPHLKATVFTGSREMFDTNIETFKSVLNNEKRIPVMTAHIQVPFISDLPATKEKKFMTDILRNDFNFQGVVITDDLEMVSVGNNIGEAAVDAILAGADMIISTQVEKNHLLILNSVKEAVLNGKISEEKLDTSVYRVLKLRENINKYTSIKTSDLEV